MLCYAMFPAPQQPNNNKPLGEFFTDNVIFLDIVFLITIGKNRLGAHPAGLKSLRLDRNDDT